MTENDDPNGIAESDPTAEETASGDRSTAGSAAGSAERPAAADQENPLINIMVNILIPVVALSMLSKTGDKAWHIGPLWGMLIAVAFPTIYGIWFLVKNRKLNLFSILGVAGIMLTGGITLYVWGFIAFNAEEGKWIFDLKAMDRVDDAVKTNAAVLFAIKEGAIPVLLGLTILASHRTRKPLVEVFLLNPDILDSVRIEKAVAKNNARPAYDALRWKGTLMLACSLFLSAVMNFFLAMHFLSGKTGKVEYNAAIGKLTWVGFLVIGIPLMVIMMTGLFYLIKKIGEITGLDKEEVFLPR